MERSNQVYKGRKEKVFELLQLLGCEFSKEQAGMFVWARIPSTYKDGYVMSDDVLYRSNVFITHSYIFFSGTPKYITGSNKHI